MTPERYLLIEVRAFVPPPGWPPSTSRANAHRNRRDRRWRDEYQWVLIYDCETTVDHRQRLLFGVCKLCRIDWLVGGPRVVPVEEAVFLGPDADEFDPGARRRTRDYVRRHHRHARVAQDDPEASGILRRLSLDQFLALRYRCCYCGGAVLCGFNLPFDEASVAGLARPSRTRGFEGGFALTHQFYVGRDGRLLPSQWRPRTDIRTLDSKRSFFAFKRPKYSDVEHTKGRFLDLKMLVFAQTSEGHSLNSACGEYGLVGKSEPALGRVDAKALTYCRDDVDATQRLLEATLREHARRGIDLAPHEAYSPASYGKAAIAQMGVDPIVRRQ